MSVPYLFHLSVTNYKQILLVFFYATLPSLSDALERIYKYITTKNLGWKFEFCIKKCCVYYKLSCKLKKAMGQRNNYERRHIWMDDQNMCLSFDVWIENTRAGFSCRTLKADVWACWSVISIFLPIICIARWKSKWAPDRFSVQQKQKWAKWVAVV